MSDVPIDPGKGLDPRATFCQRCGGDSNALAIGAMRKAKMDDGQWVYAQRGSENKVETQLKNDNSNLSDQIFDWVMLEDDERVPDPSMCPNCAKEVAEWAELVKAGGVYFRCRECGANGIIHPGEELAEQVRKRTKIAAPAPCGMEFPACAQHKQLLNSVG